MSINVKPGEWGEKMKRNAIGETVLDRGEKQEDIDSEAVRCGMIVEAAFGLYPPITQPNQGHIGGIVASKALGLNPVLFSSEVGLCLVRILAVNAENTYAISGLVRPD
ncbi:uncharacterized protein ARMOST_04522 [Armillaria ostoyae]|uniref:Uncharacterized protein n=1 Tax=Armillaria ostoyae TaxID=47428 RepID=A0A284QXL3_ARMOS|nr:uncharacterized protein ARMOST_04522 [Armillaria ostoyae]